MNWPDTIELLDVHCEGEIGRVVVGGQPCIPGNTLAEKFRYLNSGENDDLRRLLVLEPRGAASGSANLLFPPDDPNNHAGFIVLQPDQAHAMSGSNSICITTALLESGRVKMREGENLVRLETAAGLVIAKAQCKDGVCEHVSLSMTPSYVEQLDFEFTCEEFGNLTADICFGGVFYAIIDAEQLGLAIQPRNARKLVEAGMIIKSKLNEQVEISHPDYPDISGIAYTMFRGRDADGAVRTCTTMWPGRIDRSPCGTGNSANLATRALRGEVQVGDEYISRSTIGSEFKVRFDGETTIGNRQAVLPVITGRGWVYGSHTIRLDPSDPFPRGFAMTDTWGPQAGEI